MIPVVRAQQVGRIGIFLQDGRTIGCAVHPSLIARIATEARSGIMVATIAEVVHLQGIATHEDAAAPGGPCPDILLLRVTGQPETVQVAQAVTFPTLVHHLGIIFHDAVCRQLLFAPKRQPLGRQQLAGVAAESHTIVG